MARGDEGHVDRQEETEAEERDDDQIDQADGHGRRRRVRRERPQREGREADARRQRLRCALEVFARDARVGHDLRRPLCAELGGDLGFEQLHLRVDVLVVAVLVARLDVDQLDGAGRVVGGVARFDGLAEEGGGVGVDDDGREGFFLVDGLAHGQVVVVVGRGRDGDEAEVRHLVLFDDGFRHLRYHRPHERVGLGFEVDDEDDDRVEVFAHVEEDSPVKGQDGKDERG